MREGGAKDLFSAPLLLLLYARVRIHTRGERRNIRTTQPLCTVPRGQEEGTNSAYKKEGKDKAPPPPPFPNRRTFHNIIHKRAARIN